MLVGRHDHWPSAGVPRGARRHGSRHWRVSGDVGRCGARIGLDRRPLRRWPFAIALVTAVALLTSSVSAGASAQRGHTFGRSFGGEGEGAGQFRFGGAFKLQESAGIAVNEDTGDLYVVDRGNYRVQELGPEGQFIATWGWGVNDGKDEFEVCTSRCRTGIPGAGKGQLEEAGPIAVDNSQTGEGTVYVGANASAKRPDVQRFSGDGEDPLGKLPVAEEGRLDGLAADQRGRVWVYRGEEEETGVIEEFSDGKSGAELEPTLLSPVACPKPAFAVDGGGEDLYVGHELLTAEGECPAVVEQVDAEEGEPAEGKDARPVVTAKLTSAEVLGDGGIALSELARQATTGVAVDQASAAGTPLGEGAKGDVYLDEGTSVAVFDAAGSLVQSFGAGALEHGMGVAVDAKTGNVYVLDAAEDKVDMFVPEGAGPPAVEDVSAQDTSPSEVELSAKISPQGENTHYYFQYGTVDCSTDPSGCSDVPVSPGGDLGDGFGALSVGERVQGLRPGTTYYYRVVATNSLGEAEEAKTLETFSTLPSSAAVLADGRAWELVSPSEKDGAGIEPLSKEGGLIQAAGDGGAITYVATGPVVPEPVGNRAPEATQVLSVRSSQGWTSDDLAIPRMKGEGLETGEPALYRFFSEDLALGLLQPALDKVEPQEDPPLAPGASEKTLYVGADPAIAPATGEQQLYSEARANSGFLAPGYLPLVTPLNATDEVKPGEKVKFGGELNFVDATPNMGDVVFESEVPLLDGSAPGLYEWQAGGVLQLVSVLPSGVPAPAPAVGQENTNVRGALSADGSRVVFSAEGEEGRPGGLYMRDTRTQETIELSAAQGVVEPTGEESEVAFQAATSDGSKVFFTDTAPLTPESTQRQESEADLYECEMIEEHEQLRCNLKDLTPLGSGGSADVLNMIPGISEDGSSAYFMANGVLAPGAVQGHCVHESQEVPPAEAACNLYLWHDGTISLVAVLSDGDSGDWGSLHGIGRVGGPTANRPDLTDVTSRVSPNGEYLAFMSQRPLVGYETLDADHASEGIHDEEVYVYDASSQLLVCASCDSDGPPVGVHDIPDSGEGNGLLVDRRGDWTGQYLAGSIPGWTPLGIDGAIHQPQYLSDSGRLFFDSPDQLVPQATNGKEDVYEYEPQGVGSCAQESGCVTLISSGSAQQESAFLEASEDGDEAFFITAQPLVAADHDSNYDLYDARVCTASSPCFASEASSSGECEGSRSCEPGSFPAPTPESPPSATIGIANQQTLAFTKAAPRHANEPRPPTRAQLLANALKKCRTKKRGHERAKCEKQARRYYAGKRKPAKNAKLTKREHR